MSVRGFVELLGSRTPAPGGGSTAALIASMGAALGAMVGWMTYGKRKFEHKDPIMRALIPPWSGRPTDQTPTGRYRRLMRAYFRRPKRRRRYGQRWQVETVFSMIKRRLGASVNARSDRRQCRALLRLSLLEERVRVACPDQPGLQSR